MNIKTEKLSSGEEEIIIRYYEMTPEIENIIAFLNKKKETIIGKKGHEQYILPYSDIYHFESVDNLVFAYTDIESYQISYTLTELEELLFSSSFVRCNKSFIVNITEIMALRSNVGNRIDATLKNGEHIIISRHYAKGFREILKGGNQHE